MRFTSLCNSCPAGTYDTLIAEFVALRAVTTRQGMPGPEVWVLMRRAIVEPGAEVEVKVSLSNAPVETPLAELVRVSGLRWPIECCFKEGKSELGLDHYEVRSWPGWHHHMTLVVLAHHFLVRLQQRLNQRGGAFGAACPAARAGSSGRSDMRSVTAASSGRAKHSASASAGAGGAAASSA